MPIRVTAAVLRRGEKILIAQRATGALAGLWEFPGGKLEAGESPEVCLARELFEELGVHARIGEALTATVHHYPQISIELLVYRAEIVEGEPQAREHAAVAWVTIDELASYELAPADLPAVAKLREEL